MGLEKVMKSCLRYSILYFRQCQDIFQGNAVVFDNRHKNHACTCIREGNPGGRSSRSQGASLYLLLINVRVIRKIDINAVVFVSAYVRAVSEMMDKGLR